ncbi:MAG: GNAT family N-acetyltransferase [Steroidobacteraceae bacterium]
MHHDVVIRTPEHCSEEERVAFIALAERSAEVRRPDLESGFDRARFLLWTNDARGLTGVSALKIPRSSYRERVFAEAKCNLHCQDYPLEFGYLYVEEDRRDQGYGTTLVDRTLQLAESDGVFATTRETNEVFHPFLTKRGFVRAGERCKSKRGDFWLLLFVRSGAERR